MQDQDVEVKVKYNTLFGVVETKSALNNPTGFKAEFSDENKANINNYINREFGIGRKIYKNQNLIAAIAEPKVFLERKNARLLQINDNMAETYRRVYEDFFLRKFPDDVCQSKAKEAAKKEYERGLSILEEDFPKSSKEQAVKILTK